MINRRTLINDTSEANGAMKLHIKICLSKRTNKERAAVRMAENSRDHHKHVLITGETSPVAMQNLHDVRYININIRRSYENSI